MQQSSLLHGIDHFGKIGHDHEGNLASFLGFDNIISYTAQCSGRKVTLPKTGYLGTWKMFTLYEFSDLIEDNSFVDLG